jgi:1-acyl-sn-glycerol-3-phosphate acyltransferase
MRAAGFAAITSGMLSAYIARDLVTTESERGALRDRWTRRWANSLLHLFGIHVSIVGVVPAPAPGRGRLVVANHRGAVDIALLLSTFGGHLVSRGDIEGWPIIGKAAKRVGTIFVDRQDASSGATAIRSMRQVLRAGGTVNVFPEGTTFADDAIHPFHAGAFVAALRTRAEVLPVAIAYERGSQAAFVGESFMKHLTRMAGAPPTRVVVAVGEPFAVDE